VFLSEDRPVANATPGAALAKSLIDYVITGAESGYWKVYPVTVPDAPIASGANWSIRLLAPTQETRLALERTGQREPNLLSGALRIQISDHAVIIGGDAPLRTWASLSPEDLRARVFRIPHHGGAAIRSTHFAEPPCDISTIGSGPVAIDMRSPVRAPCSWSFAKMVSCACFLSGMESISGW
jgi:hypothetical protein